MTKSTELAAVSLSAPIDIDGAKEQLITLRKPKSGELRGLKLVDLMQMDVSALMTLLPRITQPPMSPQQVSDLDLKDLTRFGTKVIGFFGDMSGAEPTVNVQ